MTGHVNIFCLYPQIFPPARKICGRIRPKQIEKEIERVKNSTGLSFSENIGRLDLIRYSALPWFAFSEMKHAVSFGRGDSVPRISTGKLIKENGAYLLPISISGHHALMDGRNVAELIEKLETTKK